VIVKIKEDYKSSIIILAGENWHHGIIGIVASKIVEKFAKPTILMEIKDDLAKGSGRSIPGFDLYKALEESHEYLEKYGGHEMAVGVTLKKENLDKFRSKMEKISKEQNIGNIEQTRVVESEINIDELNTDFIKQINRLEPFGDKNPVPIYVLRDLKIDSITTISEGRHLKLKVKGKQKLFDVIGFNKGSYIDSYVIGDKVDIFATIELNTYNGVESVQINMKDMKKSI
jgi:single-stranded-DNA-specific exonuclease